MLRGVGVESGPEEGALLPDVGNETKLRPNRMSNMCVSRSVTYSVVLMDTCAVVPLQKVKVHTPAGMTAQPVEVAGPMPCTE